jgi:hypothetical protein
LPGPSEPARLTLLDGAEPAINASAASADSLSDIYREYMGRMDPDGDGHVGVMDNCPDAYNPDQADSDSDGIGDACSAASVEPEPEAAGEASDPATSKDGGEDTGLEDGSKAETDSTQDSGADDSQSEEGTAADDAAGGEADPAEPEPRVIIVKPGEED